MTMGMFDVVIVEGLSQTFQTKQLGELMFWYRLTEDGRLIAPDGKEVAYHGLLRLFGEDQSEVMAIFTHGRLERLEPVENGKPNYRCLGPGVHWTRHSW